ncbi:Universal stress protein E [Novipirellula galeiformis]|uniref:Universal stress protein E n=1 Tax=Novipirellula galeiformis TaxID=2528004 RepID=A0A5C6CGB4_9BACT|nr:universal stress protein [Novipirellula galeiformis]TWU22286.1 Universal stress protein E [Novipirellula galeiformis]
MQRFKRILCYAGTGSDETAISRAVGLAITNGAALTVMDVIKPIPKAVGLITKAFPSNDLQNLVVKDREQRLLDRMSEYADTAVSLELVVASGDPATEIIRRVIAEDIDLVIKTADGFSTTGRLFGSVARSLLRMCPCPVWLLKPEVHGPFDQVLAAIDLDTEDKVHQNLNRNILELAFSIAAREDAQLHLVSVWGLWMEEPLRKRMGDDTVDRLVGMQEAKVRQALDDLLQAPWAEDTHVHVHLERGDPAEVIRAVADQIEADLIVMGTVCRTGVPGFLIGNTADSIISELTCSMLALKPTGFLSPIEVAGKEVGR